MTGKMTKADRSELRSLLIRHSKSHKADAKARVAEMRVDAIGAMGDGYQAEDQARDELRNAVHRIAQEANEAASEVVAEHYRSWPNSPIRAGGGGIVIGAFDIRFDDTLRIHRRKQVEAELEAMLAQAHERIERTETDLREELVRETLDTDEGMKFLDRIPKVAELVPQSRLDEMLALPITAFEDGRPTHG